MGGSIGPACLLIGVVGFFYCNAQVKKFEPVPEGTSISESLKTPAGRFEVGSYAAAALGVFGLVIMSTKR